MSTLPKCCVLLAVLALAGCAHQIVITPELRSLQLSGSPIDKKVGYYISAADMETEVTTAGGGGDKVAYHPYKELEPALQKVLFNLFRDVQRVNSFNDASLLKQQGIAYVFVPTIRTESSSSGVFTWMPTHFVVLLSCTAYDDNAQRIWSGNFSGTGEAEFSELKADFSAAAHKASLAAFRQLEDALSQAPEFRKP
ncbi:MAG TPA: hypothetical protein VGX51_08485 [Solirubrobacteraceae bacterium]|jgi:hypothetical protein|nr:hypothetical protein [Solirubrobacteraceae bacterium]